MTDIGVGLKMPLGLMNVNTAEVPPGYVPAGRSKVWLDEAPRMVEVTTIASVFRVPIVPEKGTRKVNEVFIPGAVEDGERVTPGWAKRSTEVKPLDCRALT